MSPLGSQPQVPTRQTLCMILKSPGDTCLQDSVPWQAAVVQEGSIRDSCLCVMHFPLLWFLLKSQSPWRGAAPLALSVVLERGWLAGQLSRARVCPGG